jgi:hypothetical protein
MEDAHIRPMMGLDILEPLPPVGIAYHPRRDGARGSLVEPVHVSIYPMSQGKDQLA